jgi:activator of 2-hydroxyglutaryl-CoA dehydratase/benzoyl-CoA reductase/2-hydroxyglutaryl-CoA dehydratase subunit BcrC/BadD/HgdB
MVFPRFLDLEKVIGPAEMVLLDDEDARNVGKCLVIKVGYLRRILKGKCPVVWRTFFVPPELINAAGAAALAPERIVTLLGMKPESRRLQDYINNAEAAGHDRKECSFAKGLYGLAHADFMMPPSLLITSPSYCSAIPAAMRHIAMDMEWPHIHLNIPQTPCNKTDYAYLKEQMLRMAVQICKITGIDHERYEKESLPRALNLSNAAKAEWLKIQSIRNIRPDLLEQPAAMDLALNLSDDWGTESLLNSLRKLRENLEGQNSRKSELNDSFIRLYWLHLRPYFPNGVFEIIRQHSAVVCSEGVNTIPWEDLDPTAPYESLAKKAIQCSEIATYGPSYKSHLHEALEQDKIDGVIYFFHENCQWAEETYPSIREDLSRKRHTKGIIPLLGLHAESLVPSAQSAMDMRLAAFLQGVQQAKGLPIGRASIASVSDLQRHQATENWFVGLDAGSTFVKAVLVNESGKVLCSVMNRINGDICESVNLCLSKALALIGKEVGQWRSFVATGVSQDAVHNASERISEILCHAEAIKKLLPKVTAFIEVGGQDVKGIDLATGMAALNDRCAAGIGAFIEEFSEMLKLEQADRLRLYSTADRAVPFPTLCKAIIQTEIRHAVGRRESLPSIVKGFYDALAKIAVNSVCEKIPSDSKLVGLCGGTAMDPAFVKAVQNALGSSPQICVPHGPIFTGALGASLLALKLSGNRGSGELMPAVSNIE